MSSASNIERVVTSGTFELDGGSWDVDNNIWIVGDDHDVVGSPRSSQRYVHKRFPWLADSSECG